MATEQLTPYTGMFTESAQADLRREADRERAEQAKWRNAATRAEDVVRDVATNAKAEPVVVDLADRAARLEVLLGDTRRERGQTTAEFDRLEGDLGTALLAGGDGWLAVEDRRDGLAIKLARLTARESALTAALATATRERDEAAAKAVRLGCRRRLPSARAVADAVGVEVLALRMRHDDEWREIAERQRLADSLVEALDKTASPMKHVIGDVTVDPHDFEALEVEADIVADGDSLLILEGFPNDTDEV